MALSAKPCMTVILTFENRDGKSEYTAWVWHGTIADCEQYEKMGFYEGRAQYLISGRLSWRSCNFVRQVGGTHLPNQVSFDES
jgi:hypothetical protein